MIKVMVYQEDDTYMDDEWLNDYERSTHFSKARDQIVGRFKGSEYPFSQGHQYYKEYLVVRERVPIRNERPLVSETDTYENNAPIGQVRNDDYSTNIR